VFNDSTQRVQEKHIERDKFNTPVDIKIFISLKYLSNKQAELEQRTVFKKSNDILSNNSGNAYARTSKKINWDLQLDTVKQEER